MSPDDFIEQFGTAVDVGQASLLVGAGLSIGAGYPSWLDLVEAAAVRLGVAPVDDPSLWAQYVANQEPDGAAVLLEEVVATIAAVRPFPLDNHRLLAKLPVRDIWTTNYDSLLETADGTLEVVEQDVELTQRRQGVRRLYKMHGSIRYLATGPVGRRDQLVITRDDYERYQDTHPRLWRLLQGQFLTSSFLFLGFSLTDPNFDAVFALVRRAIRDRLMPHYALMRRPADDVGVFDLKCADLARIGIRTVEIDHYDEVPELLRRLVARTLPPRLFVSGSHRVPTDDPWNAGDYPTAAAVPGVDDVARKLGLALAAADVPGVVAGGEVGAAVGYSYLDALPVYGPDRFTLVRRRSTEDLSPPRSRLGVIRFAGDDPSELRDQVFESVRCLVVVGGGDGTREEADRARQRGMSVIPLGVSGGAARVIWFEMQADLGRPPDRPAAYRPASVRAARQRRHHEGYRRGGRSD